MLYIIAVVLGAIIGLTAGGKPSNLYNIRFERKGFILAAFAIQIIAQVMSVKGIEFVITYSYIVYGVVFCLALVGFWHNRHYTGVLVVGVGCIMNAAVMLANGGKMPVSYEALAKTNMAHTAEFLKASGNGKHMLAGDNVNLEFLSDIIPLPQFLGMGMNVVSLGDLMVTLGILVLVAEFIAAKSFRPSINSGKFSVFRA
ncbi:MAG: DUF5317 domain-containing protein [Clostridia bacterium]|nr:DUF5317 domain-containing protein [Clostridia bacterium]